MKKFGLIAAIVMGVVLLAAGAVALRLLPRQSSGDHQDATAQKSEVATASESKPVTAKAHPRNILFITIDTLRADHLKCYGYKRDTSPNIDRFAREGLLFENAFAQRGLTWPSLASMMTALYPVSHGVRDNGVMISGAFLQFPEVLKEKGYATGAFLSNCSEQQWKGFDKIDNAQDNDSGTVDYAVAWLRQRPKDQPFFAWVHLMAPHWNYTPPKPYDTLFDPEYTGRFDGSNQTYLSVTKETEDYPERDLTHLIALYDGEVAFADAQVGRLWDVMKETGFDANTLLIFASDHGEELHDHNNYTDHKASVYEAVMRIPLIMRAPGCIPQGRRDQAVVESIDLAPTLLRFMGLEVPAPFQGTALNLSGDGPSKPPAPAFGEWEDRILTLRTGDMKLIHNPSDFVIYNQRAGKMIPFPIQREELYDIAKDPGETRNIAGAHPEIVADLAAKLEQWSKKYNWVLNTGPYTPPELPESIKKEMEALGYLQ